MPYYRRRRFFRSRRPKYTLRRRRLFRPRYRLRRRAYRTKGRRIRTALPFSGVYKLRFNAAYTLNTGGAATFVKYAFRGNGIYDPDYTGTGGQPSGYAQLASTFKYVKVVSSSCDLRIPTTYNQTNTNVYIGLRARGYLDSAWATTNELVNNCEEADTFARGRWIMGQSNPSIWNRLRMYATSRKMLGLWNGEPDSGAEFGSNPTYAWFWDVGVAGSVFNTTQTFYVTITYYVRCWGRKVENAID